MSKCRSYHRAGGDTLITTCPKCRIHFKCGMSRRQDVEIKIEDLSTLVADAIIGENHAEYGFLKVKDIFNSPVDCTKEGIFICGYAQSPKDIPECCTS